MLRQINLDTQPVICKRKVKQQRRSRSTKSGCIENWNVTNEARIGAKLQLYCQLSASCGGLKVMLVSSTLIVFLDV